MDISFFWVIECLLGNFPMSEVNMEVNIGILLRG